MFDFGLLLLGGLASASAMTLFRRQWNRQRLAQHLHDFPALDADSPAIAPTNFTLAATGWLQISAPQVPGPRQTLSGLYLAEGALYLQHSSEGEVFELPLQRIQWISPVELLQDGSACLHLHVALQQTWRIFSLALPEADMLILVSLLRRAIPLSRSSLGSAPFRPLGPIPARVASQTWQGEMFGGPEVGLYLLPHWLVVLTEDQVAAKLALSSVRRILAVQRRPNWADKLLRQNQTDGVLHLYSMSESVSFLLPQYRELGEEIGLLAPCPVEIVNADAKRNKR